MFSSEEVVKLIGLAVSILVGSGIIAAIVNRISGDRFRSEVNDANETLFKFSEEQRKQIADLKSDISAQKVEIQDLRKENKELSIQFEARDKKFVAQLRKAELTSVGLQAQIIDLQRDNSLLTSQIDHLTRINTLLTNENTILRKYYDERAKSILETAPIPVIPQSKGDSDRSGGSASGAQPT